MANVLLPAHEIEGLILPVDRRKIQKPFVMEGTNFLVDVDGPYSGFGSQLLSYEKLANLTNVETIRVGNHVFLANSKGLFDYEPNSKLFIPVFVYDSPISDTGPWTVAFVGNRYYICHAGAPLIEYAVFSNTWTTISEFVPEGLVACCESNGRLILLGEEWVAWSALGEGWNLEPDLATMAGNQSISLIGGLPVTVKPYPTGFLTYTTFGIMKSEYSSGISPFRHTPLTTEIVPINPYCVTSFDNRTQIILDIKGFYQTQGALPEPWQPPMGEYLSHILFRELRNDVFTPYIIRQTYNTNRKLFCVSIATAEAPEIYYTALVFYTPSGKWGSFDQEHLMFGEVDVNSATPAGFQFGFISPAGFFHVFDEVQYVEIAPDLSSWYSYNRDHEIPARVFDEITIFSSAFTISCVNDTQFEDYDSGLYQPINQESLVDMDFALEIEDPEALVTEDVVIFTTAMEGAGGFRPLERAYYSPEIAGLNSSISIGLFRFTEQQESDELQLLTEISIGMSGQGTAGSAEDWMVTTGEEDWLSDTGSEDWGFQIASGNIYQILGQTTNDGHTPYLEEIPYLANQTGAKDYYTCSLVGVYSHFIISAIEIGESYHVRVLELSGTVAGRLN